MNRTLLAGLLGGLILFAWGAFSHMVLPLGHMGFSSVENEPALLAALKTHTPEAGTYFLPDMEKVPMEEWPASGPAAFLVWRPETSYGFGKNMAVEFTSNVLAALLAACLLGCGAACNSRLLCRATAVMGMGIFAWLSISASQWNWYGFSDGIFLAEGIDQAVGWFLAGLAIAALIKPKAA